MSEPIPASPLPEGRADGKVRCVHPDGWAHHTTAAIRAEHLGSPVVAADALDRREPNDVVEVAKRALNLLDLVLGQFFQPETNSTHARMRTGWVVPDVLAVWRDTSAELRAALGAPVVAVPEAGEGQR